MTLGKRLYWVLALVAILALAAVAVTVTSRFTSAGGTDAAQTCSAEDEAAETANPGADAGDIEEECGAQDEDDADSAAAGQLDDGKDLLPQASISLDEAIAAAQTAATGDIGEIDLERYQGKLVFNIDVGDQDVKVDASSGAVLGIGED